MMAGVAADDAFDRLRRRVLWALPAGLYLLGSRSADGSRRNLMTLSWAMQVATSPKLVAVGVEADAVTRGLVEDGGVFSVSLLNRDDRAVVRRFAKPADDDFGGHAVFEAATGAPILAAAAAWLDCEVRHALDLGSHTLFVGEVVDCGYPAEGAEILRMEDTRMSYGG